MAALPDGRIAFGTGTSGNLAIYDPGNGNVDTLTSAPLSFLYAMHYATDGYLYGALNSQIFAVEPLTDSIVRTFSIPSTENPVNSITSDSSENVYFSTSPTGYLLKYNYTQDTLDNLGTPVLGDDCSLARLADNRIAGISGDGIVFIYDQTSSTFSKNSLVQSLNVGQGVASLSKGPDGNIYGGTRINQHFFKLDASTKTFHDFGRDIIGAGEVHSMTNSSTGRKIYLGSFTGARLSVYDTDSGWNPGSDSTSNPRWIGQVAPGQTWIITMTTLPDGRVLIGTEPDFGGFSGHYVYEIAIK